MAFRKRKMYDFLSVLVNLVLIDAVNFRGFFFKEKCNSTFNVNFKNLGAYHGTSRAFDNELLSFNDSTLIASAQISANSGDVSGFILRSLFFPINKD